MGRRHRRTDGGGRRIAAAVLVCALLATACGARFSEEERELLIADLSGGGGAVEATGATAGGGQQGAAGSGSSESSTTGPATTATPGTANTGTTNSGTATTGGEGTTGQPATPADGGEQAPDEGDGGQAPAEGGGEAAPAEGGGQAAQPQDTRAAPPGGNGGATDVGVTETSITISNISDTSGAVPGLFLDTQQAVNAYIAKFTSEEGTVYGRQIELINRDAGLDTNKNRREYLSACQDSLAAVGSMSAFEQGAAQPIQECGLPDVRTASVNPEMQDIPQVVSTDAFKPNFQPLSPYRYWQEVAPDAVTRAGAVFIDSATTEAQTNLVKAGTETIGYEWIATIEVSLTETNYAPIVIELKDKGVEFVYFQGAYQQASRLAKAMRQQQYFPTVYALQSNAYTPDLIADGGEDVQGVQIAVPSALVEEQDQFPELAEYNRWLQQVAPGASPTSLGMYAWASARLFVQALKEIGPEVTRQRLLAHLDGISGYDANGLIPPQNIGSGVPADCDITVEVVGDRFERVSPEEPGTFRCGDGPVEVAG